MSAPSVSIVIPAFNEESRLPPFLEALVRFRDAGSHPWGIVVVDDGSTDRTAQLAGEAAARCRDLRLISHAPNRGKGEAVRRGVLESSGDFVLFIDADGSIKPSEILALLTALEKADLAVGVRTGQVQQPAFRTLARWGLNTCVRCLFGPVGSDCLCGLKGFRRGAAETLFRTLRSPRWTFDVEILARALRLGLSIVEVPISWEYRAGSKMRPWTPLSIAASLVVLRFRF